MNVKVNDYLSYINICCECKIEKRNLYQNKTCFHKLCLECYNKSVINNAEIKCDCGYSYSTKDYYSKLSYENYYESQKNARRFVEDNNLKFINDFQNIKLYNDYLYTAESTVFDLLNNDLRDKATSELENNKNAINDKNKILKEREINYFKKMNELCNPLILYSNAEQYKQSMLSIYNQEINQNVNTVEKVVFTKQIRLPQYIPNQTVKREKNPIIEKIASGRNITEHHKMYLNYFYDGI